MSDRGSINNITLPVYKKLKAECSVVRTESKITELSDDVLNKLKVGDMIAKKTGNQKHNYIVTYKEEKHGICLSYYAAGYIETVSYDYTNGHWVYNSTDVFNADEKVDKDVLDKIVVDSYEGITLFPSNVLPLRIRCDDNETYYFDYEKGFVLEEDGTQYTEILLEDKSVKLDSDFPGIVEIDYAYFNGTFRKLNTYYMYHPISSLVFFEAHSLAFTDTNGVSYYLTSDTYLFLRNYEEISEMTTFYINLNFEDEDGVKYPGTRVTFEWDSNSNSYTINITGAGFTVDSWDNGWIYAFDNFGNSMITIEF